MQRWPACIVAILVLTGSSGRALAGVAPIYCTDCSVSSEWIDLGGVNSSGTPDPACRFTVIVRSAPNTPVAGADVVIDFSGCPDILISCTQVPAVAGSGQEYAGDKTVHGTTDASGQLTLWVQGAANAVLLSGNVISAGTNIGVPCAYVRTSLGQILTPLKVVAYDVNGLGSPGNAVNGADASLVTAEVIRAALGATPRCRDDYTHSNSLTGADAARAGTYSTNAQLGNGTQKTGPFCP